MTDLDIRSQIGIELLDEEKRSLTFAQFEMRNKDGNPEFVGYASVFDRPSNPLPDARGRAFREEMRRGAFKDVLASNPDVIFNFNHNNDNVLGRTSAGTVTLEEDGRGLLVRGQFPDTTWANDLKVSIERNDIASMSFAFRVTPEGEKWSQGDGMPTRSVTRVSRLGDVSVVTTPAYDDAEILSLRSNQIKVDELWATVIPDAAELRTSEETDESSETSIVNDSDTEVTVEATEGESEAVTESSPEAEDDTLLLGARTRMAQLRAKDY